VQSATDLPEKTPMARDERIRTRAWQLWDQAGRPEGRDEEFWLQAEIEIREMEELRELAKEPPPS
jgi:regulation of enolase protein 1 (concanavalin A-like superfamily)